MTLEVVTTEDGSITCRDQGTGELYHNRAGAYTEALHNYVEPSHLKQIIEAKRELKVLDVCFGLGYNTFVLALELLNQLDAISAGEKFNLAVMAIDRDPEIIKVLPEVLADERLKRLDRLARDFTSRAKAITTEPFVSRRQIENKNVVALDLTIKFVELRKEVPELVRQGKEFDLIFHDGFSPKNMPELWTYELFEQYSHLIGKRGLILTYSSATAVRGALRLCGLTVKRTAKVGGKSGGTVAGGAEALLDNPFALPLTDQEETRLNSRSAIPYRDPNLKDVAEDIRVRRLSEVNESSLSVFKKGDSE
jgi:tRNA U34 5-methylaminomethyl-2-thiouridine-forming methyltransferase MnmC